MSELPETLPMRTEPDQPVVRHKSDSMVLLVLKATKALYPVLMLWSLLALLVFYGNRYSFVDSYAIAYNNSKVLRPLLLLAVVSGCFKIIAKIVPQVPLALAQSTSALARPLERIPVYARKQLSMLIRVAFIISIIFYGISSLRSSSAYDAFNAGLAQIPVSIPLFGVQGIMMLVFFVAQFMLLFAVLSRGGIYVYLPDEVKTNFSNVWGQDAVVEKVKEMVKFIKEPEVIESLGGHVPGGLLLWGPPGTGKTLIAEAIAGETSVPFVLVEPAAFQNMFVGIGPLRVKMLYKKLRKLSSIYGGVVVFFDEADVLGSRGPSAQHTSESASVNKLMMPRIGGGGDPGILNAILASMQGVRTPKGLSSKIRRSMGLPAKHPKQYRIMHVMATNMPDSLDPALLRPGRIDRIFRVGYPSLQGRQRTYQGYLDKVSNSLSAAQVLSIALMTPNASGAVIKDIVNEALIIALNDSRRSIEWSDMLKAKRYKEFGPSEGVEYVPYEQHAVAVHESCHALVAWRLRKNLTIDTVTIEKGNTYLGLVSSIPTAELYTKWGKEYRIDIAVSLASLAGERMFFNDSTSGVSGDLETATNIATQMLHSWGMGENISVVKKDPSTLDVSIEVEEMLKSVYDDVRKMLEKDRHLVLALAHALETHKTLSGADARAILELSAGHDVDGRIYDSSSAKVILENYHSTLLGDKHAAALMSPVQVYEQLSDQLALPDWPERSERPERID